MYNIIEVCVMDSKIILLKFPDNKFHTASVTRFVSVPYKGQEINTIWYVDLTELDTEEKNSVGSFSIIRDNLDGTYTNLNCGSHDEYEKIYNELKEEIIKKNYTQKELNTLPYSIDTVEDYDFFARPEDTEVAEEVSFSDNIINIRRELYSRIGAFVIPSSRDDYLFQEEELCNHLSELEKNLSDSAWEDIKNDILSYLTLKQINMNAGYILLQDAVSALKEIEEFALSEYQNSKGTTEAFEDNNQEKQKEIISFVEEPSEKEKNYQYTKTIYVLWNKLISNVANFVYLEYNSYLKLNIGYSINYRNITDNYRQINRELINIIKEKDLTINTRNIVTVKDNLINYKFYIIPLDDPDIFRSLKDSQNPIVLSGTFQDSYTAITEALKRKNMIITERETLGIFEQ